MLELRDILVINETNPLKDIDAHNVLWFVQDHKASKGLGSQVKTGCLTLILWLSRHKVFVVFATWFEIIAFYDP